MSKIEVDEIVNQTGDNDTGIDLSTNDVIKFDIAGAEKAKVDNSGNVLVAKTAQDQTVVGAEFRSNGIGAFTVDGTAPFRVNRLTDNGTLITLLKDSTTVGRIGVQSSGFFVDGENFHAGIRFASTNLIPRRSNNDIDNTIALGSSSLRFDDAFIKNGVTTGSDQNEKQDIESLTAKELNVAKKLSALFKTYKWKDAVAEKGDKARTHTGIIAQEVQSAFSAEGLDASNYGMFMSDTWTNEEGKEQTRLGVRYPELFSFVFSSIEARLTALESK